MTVSVQEEGLEEVVGRPQKPRPAQGGGTQVVQEEGELVRFGIGSGSSGGVRTGTLLVEGEPVQLGTRLSDLRRLV